MSDSKNEISAMAGQGSMGLGLYGSLQGTPPVETLLSLRLLKDSNETLFKELAREETKFLTGAIALVRNDPMLRLKFGGDVLTASLNLSKQLKVHAEELNIRDRLDTLAKAMNEIEINSISKDLQPSGINTFQFLDKDGALGHDNGKKFGHANNAKLNFITNPENYKDGFVSGKKV